MGYIEQCIEDIIDACFEQYGIKRRDYTLRYIVMPKGVVWADHIIDTGHHKLDVSLKQWLLCRGANFNLYFSLDPMAREYCLNIRACLKRLRVCPEGNFGFPIEAGRCYAFKFEKPVRVSTPEPESEQAING